MGYESNKDKQHSFERLKSMDARKLELFYRLTQGMLKLTDDF